MQKPSYHHKMSLLVVVRSPVQFIFQKYVVHTIAYYLQVKEET